MKIGIMTYHRAENYGSALQAFALNWFLRNQLDVEAETVDYSSESQQEIYRIYQPERNAMDMFRNIHSLWHHKALKRRKVLFHDFLQANVPMSKFHGDNRQELLTACNSYDAMICGSDQIWNVGCTDYDSSYMLDGVTAPRIAYAPSLGVASFTEDKCSDFKRCLPSFTALSTRETSGAKFLSELLSRDVEAVCDPVLLLTKEQWIDQLKLEGDENANRKPYILCYFIGHTAGMREFAQKVSRKTGMRAIVIIKNLRNIGRGFKNELATGPREFLSLLYHSSIIITDSFHAVSFSLIFHKKFWVFVDNTDGKRPNSRITNILNLAKLESRILTPENCNPTNCNSPIDFSYSDKQLSEFRNQSVAFLKNSIDSLR